MDGEQQPVYEQYPNYKDVRGVKKIFYNNIVNGKNSNRNSR